MMEVVNYSDIWSRAITALIRTHPGREELTKRAISSCNNIHYNLYYGEKVNDYSYNLYSNNLKSNVTHGYFFYLDSDDFIIDGAILKVLSLLKPDHANIVQMLRNGRPKPRTPQYIKRGYIGGPCLILHSQYKSISDWTATECGDWDWINGVIKHLPINFIPTPLVDAGKRSHGK